MKKLYSKYRLKLVKEEGQEYTTEEVSKQAKSPAYLANIFMERMELHLEPEEVLLMVTLDVKSNITGVFEVSRGDISRSIVSTREVFKRALMNNAAGIAIAHNHPAGGTEPSNDDIKITEKLKKAGKLLGVNLVDHLIITDYQFTSLREEGYM